MGGGGPPTALGNMAAGLVGLLWDRLEMWQFFLVLVVMCWLACAFLFTVLKKLERAAVS